MTWFCSWLSDVEADASGPSWGAGMLERYCAGPEWGSQVRRWEERNFRSGAAACDQAQEPSLPADAKQARRFTGKVHWACA